MENTKHRKLFFNFLREHHIAGEYVLEYYHHYPKSKQLNDFLKRDPKNWTIQAFFWDKSIKGDTFWLRVHYIWLKTLKAHE